MTLHAPQSRTRLISIIARRAVFRKSNLLAAGAIVSASVVFADRGGDPEEATHRLTSSFLTSAESQESELYPAVQMAMVSPISIPHTLGRPLHNDHLTDADTRSDTEVEYSSLPKQPSPAAQQDLDPTGIDTSLTLTGIDHYHPQGTAPDIDDFEAPEPDWDSLEALMGPQIPDIGAAPLSPESDAVISQSDVVPDFDVTPLKPIVKSVSAGNGESFEEILARTGASEEDQRATVIALRADNINEMIAEGDRIDVAFSPEDHELLAIRLMVLDRAPIELRWDGDTEPLWNSLDGGNAEDGSDIEAASFATAALTPTVDGRETQFASGRITSSLYGAAKKSGMNAKDIQRLSDLFRYIIDFERDFRKNDRFEVLFEKEPDGKNGEILYAKLTNRGSQIALYRGQNAEGEYGYYDATGRSNKRALMRTPIAKGEVSSSFGMRKHPILGYNKMHRGVDFRAARGTPIFAAGDGIVDFVGRRGGYGKYIRIRHNGNFKTAYAHLSKYASKLHRGQRVKQGEVIGYVGTTGRSTGPHLHFEVLKGDHQVNPMDVADFGEINGLKGPDLSRFKARVARTEIAIGLLREQRLAAR